jgi:hypothetical protein
VGNAQALHVKAKAVLRQLGHSEGEPHREYKDWHIDVRAGLSYVSIWWSARMVFLSLNGIPVYYRAGPWEQYLDLLFHRAVSGRGAELPESSRLRALIRDQLDT